MPSKSKVEPCKDGVVDCSKAVEEVVKKFKSKR